MCATEAVGSKELDSHTRVHTWQGVNGGRVPECTAGVAGGRAANGGRTGAEGSSAGGWRGSGGERRVAGGGLVRVGVVSGMGGPGGRAARGRAGGSTDIKSPLVLCRGHAGQPCPPACKSPRGSGSHTAHPCSTAQGTRRGADARALPENPVTTQGSVPCPHTQRQRKGQKWTREAAILVCPKGLRGPLYALPPRATSALLGKKTHHSVEKRAFMSSRANGCRRLGMEKQDAWHAQTANLSRTISLLRLACQKAVSSNMLPTNLLGCQTG